MKNTYEKPIAEILLLQTEAIMTGEGGVIPDLSGEEGWEEWD